MLLFGMKKMLFITCCIISINLFIFSRDADDKNKDKGNIDYFNIKPIPVPREIGAPLCIYWEFSIRNADRVELFHKTGEKTIRIFVKESDLPAHFVFNSWKDAGLTHCPFKPQNSMIKSALYFYKIKTVDSKNILTRTFMINKE